MKTENLDSGEFTDSLSYVDIGEIVKNNNSQQNRYDDLDGHGLIEGAGDRVKELNSWSILDNTGHRSLIHK